VKEEGTEDFFVDVAVRLVTSLVPGMNGVTPSAEKAALMRREAEEQLREHRNTRAALVFALQARELEPSSLSSGLPSCCSARQCRSCVFSLGFRAGR
jgi:hypothetical protein